MARQLKVIQREEWGARPPRSRFLMELPAPKTAIHHTAGAHPDRPGIPRHKPPSFGQRLFKTRAAEYMRGIQAFHMDTRGWSDIAYSFIIFRAFFGRLWIFEGRGWGVVGAHTAGHNSTTHALAFVGDFTKETPGRRMLLGARILLDRGVKRGAIAGPRRSHPTGGHKDFSGAQTACPGTNLERALDKMRRTAS